MPAIARMDPPSAKLATPAPNPESRILSPKSRVSICIPHWQVGELIALCLRSIRCYSAEHEVEIIVVDNGSRDGSLQELRRLEGIRLIERPEESVANWPANVFTAWDAGLQEASGEFFVTMHTDVLVRREGWLERLLSEFRASPDVAAVGAWKLDLEPAWYTWQKELFGSIVDRVKLWMGRRPRGLWSGGRYPRDYCAMYRRDVLLEHGLSFCPGDDAVTGGYSIARQLWARGYRTQVIPTAEMARNVVHIAHGTAALAAKPLHHQAAQRKVERRVARLFQQPWVKALRDAVS